MADRLAAGAAGRVIIVGKAGLANIDAYKNIFDVDANGQVLFAATVDAAIGLCNANSGDSIYVLPGHTETVTSTSIALDVAGIRVVHLGEGANQAVYTFGAAAATITVTGANSTWKGGRFAAAFADVAAAFTVGAAANFTLEGGFFYDTASNLNFLSIIVTGSTNNQADGLRVIGNSWYALAATGNAFVSILANENHLFVADNFMDSAATNNVGHFITLSSKIIKGARIVRNTCVVLGATTATVGIFLTGSGTTSTGLVADNRCSSLDTTTELMFTASTGLVYFDNKYTGTADASGYLVPAADSAA